MCFFLWGGGAELVWSGPGPLRGWIFFPSGARLSLEANDANAASAAGTEQQENHKHCVLVAK